jgi:Short C-terminal domain
MPMMRRGRRGPGLIGTAVVAGGAAHMGAKSAQRSQAAAQQEAAQSAQSAELQAQQAAAAAPAAPAEPDDAAEIQKYARLKEQGLLTEEEFEAKKKQILGI